MKKVYFDSNLCCGSGYKYECSGSDFERLWDTGGNADDLNSDVNWSWNDDYHRQRGGSNVYEDDYDYDDPYFYVGASWYLNKATNSFSINGGYQRWNNFGGELNVMTDQSFQALFYDFNLGVNWSFGLWKTGEQHGYADICYWAFVLYV